MEWDTHNPHQRGMFYTTPWKIWLGFHSCKPLETELCSPSAWWAGELAEEVPSPQLVGHQVTGNAVPDAEVSGTKMWCQKHPFKKGIFRPTNWIYKGQIPGWNKEMMPISASTFCVTKVSSFHFNLHICKHVPTILCRFPVPLFPTFSGGVNFNNFVVYSKYGIWTTSQTAVL